MTQEGNAWVYGNAKIFGNAKVSNFNVINIFGLKWSITISDYHIQIGSELHKIKEWEKFSDKKILQMADDVLSWWKVYKDIILSIALIRRRRLDFDSAGGKAAHIPHSPE